MSSPLDRVAAAGLTGTAATNAAEPPAGHGEADAAALRDRCAARLQSVREDLAEQHASVALMLRDRLAELHADREHSAAWVRQREAEIREEAAKALDDLDAEAAEAIADVRERAAKASERKPRDAQEAQLLEARMANEWVSLKMVLDAAVRQSNPLAALEAAAESAAAGDMVKAQALRRFGPDWIASALIGEPRYARQRALDALNAAVARAEEPHLTPLQKQARAILADVDRGTDRMRYNSAQVRREASTYDGWKAAALTGWGDDNGIVPLSDRGRTDIPTEHLAAAFGERAQAWAQRAGRAYPRLAGVPTDYEKRANWLRAHGYPVADE